jgi:hypothetical protein
LSFRGLFLLQYFFMATIFFYLLFQNTFAFFFKTMINIIFFFLIKWKFFFSYWNFFQKIIIKIPNNFLTFKLVIVCFNRIIHKVLYFILILVILAASSVSNINKVWCSRSLLEKFINILVIVHSLGWLKWSVSIFWFVSNSIIVLIIIIDFQYSKQRMLWLILILFINILKLFYLRRFLLNEHIYG